MVAGQPNNNQIVPNSQSVSVAVNQKAIPQYSSPWEEEIDPSEAPNKKPMIVGSFDAENEQPDKALSDPFLIPQDIDEKVGQKVPAANYIEQKPQPSQAQAAPNQESNNQPVIVPPQSTNQRVIDGVRTIAPPVPSVSQPESPAGANPVPLPPSAPPKRAVSAEKSSVLGTLRNRLLGPKRGDTLAPPLSTSDEYVAEKLGQDLLKKAEVQPIENIPPISNKPKGRLVLVALVTIIIIPFILIATTEMGLFSVGLEKVYGAIGLERIWGGLPISTERAIVMSTIKMKNMSDYKVRGSMTWTIDKSIESPVTSPLVAFNNQNPDILEIVTAQATADSYGSSPYYDYYNSTSDSTSTTSDALEDDSSATTPTTSTSTTNKDQNEYPSYQYEGAKVKDIAADLSASFSSEGNSSTLVIRKTTGNYQIDLMNKDDKLWLKSDSQIKYNTKARSGQWSEYTISKIKGKTIQKDIFSLRADLGFSAEGKRLGSEKIGDKMTYHYKIEKLEVGNSLASIGILSNMIQSASGDLWVGVSDKLVYRLELKINTAPSAAATSIVLSADFYDYGVANSFQKPSDSNIIKVSGEDLELSNDDRRKNDLSAIHDALESYKATNGSYPESKTLAKLNVSGNILESRLVSSYIESLPSDPKAADGWYYGYKSDGSTYSLTARLENTEDEEATKAGEIYLYFIYND